jgi:hypothetical protein
MEGSNNSAKEELNQSIPQSTGVSDSTKQVAHEGLVNGNQSTKGLDTEASMNSTGFATEASMPNSMAAAEVGAGLAGASASNFY